MVGPESAPFYDDAGVHERYTAHRADAPHRSPNHVMEEPAVLAEVGDPTGLRVLDLGCGDGTFGRDLLAAGARSYHGVDSSHRMVKQASRNLAGGPGTVSRTRLEDVVARPGAFDLVTARLSLHYVADLDAVIGVAARSLAPGGRLVLTVVHPVITSFDHRPPGPRTRWTVDDYFERGPRERDWLGSTVTWHHRTVEDHVAAVLGAGLTLTALRECEPDPARCAGHPAELARRRRVPLFLLVHARA